MTKEQMSFAKRADKFKVYCDIGTKDFDNYRDAAVFYNNHLQDKYVELSASMGIVGMTLAYHKSSV